MNNAIEVGIVINTPVEIIWEVLTKPEKMKEWYFTVNDFELRERCEFYFYEPHGTNFKHVCKILEIDPLKRIRHTWTYPEITPGISIVSWDLLPLKGNKTKVRLKHEGIENLKPGGDDFARENFEVGWKEILNKSLPDYLKRAYS